MKKISSPHKNDFVKKDELPAYTDITVEDVRKWKKQLDDAGVKDRCGGQMDVTEISETHYKITGKGISITIRKDIWNESLMKAAGIKSLP